MEFLNHPKAEPTDDQNPPGGIMMKITILLYLSIVLIILASLYVGCTPKEPEKVAKRVGMVVGIKPEAIEEYKRLHDDGEPGVRDLLNKYHMHNFSIYLTEIDGKWYEFGYYEYTGKNFEADMAELAKEQRNIDWLKTCDPMQLPLKGETGWREMELVYRNP